MKNKKSIVIISAVVALLVAAIVATVTIVLLSPKNKNTSPVSENNPAPVSASILKDGRQCYTYDHEATKAEPYTVNEFIDITINGTTVTGTKTGTQSGPDMTNGYTGTITGTTDGNTINDVYSYIVEGSANKEEEIYRARPDQIGIEKLRYPLIEEKGILVPDTTKDFTPMLYARVGCEASD